MNYNRETLKIVVVGHVDHGKSSVIGRLLCDTKSLPEGAVERVKRISKEKGKQFEFAYLLDAFEEEQKQGITIDTTQLQFHTDKRDYVIIDAPGHKEFLKNMISGAANAEAALLIIDAQEGIQEQSKRHGYILSLLGIQNVYVIVNKMDLIDYSEEKFNKIKIEMDSFLNSLNIFPSKYIPISAIAGENMTSESAKMPWYKDTYILKAIDDFEKACGLEEKPLRFPIQDVYKFDNRRIIAGRIESGRLKVGDEIMISPDSKVTRVKSIEYWAQRDKSEVVEAGQSVGITVEDEFFNNRGEIISHKNDEPIVSDLFKANIFWMGKNSLIKGKKYKLKLATQETECEIFAINKVIDSSSLEVLSDSMQVNINDVGEIIIKTKDKVSFDLFKDNEAMGRFVIVDGFDVCGGGIVSGVEHTKTAVSYFVKGNLKIYSHCFDEFYYDKYEGVIKKHNGDPKVYEIGNPIPVEGQTYSYPSDFDLIDIERSSIAIIRDERLQNVITLNDYYYENVPLINDLGFAIKINTVDEFNNFKTDLYSLKDSNFKNVDEFINKWMRFSKYRSIKYKSNDSSIIEYQI